MALSNDEKERLKVVLEVAGDNLNNIHYGVVKAISDVHNKGQRAHLWVVLPQAAMEKIRRARRNAERPKFLVLTP